MITNHIGALMLGVLIIAGCTSEEDRKIEELRQQIAAIDDELGPCSLARTWDAQNDGEEALAEWDKLAAGSIDNISKEQEWEIRKSLGKEMGLAPSEVDGWKDIYRARAKAAEAKSKRMADASSESEKAVENLCANEWKLRESKLDLENDLRKVRGY